MKEAKKINLICERRLEKYFSITEQALKIAKKSINPEKKAEATEILDMAENYLSDAQESHILRRFFLERETIPRQSSTSNHQTAF